MIAKTGVKFPKPVKTGTTIAGIVFKVSVALKQHYQGLFRGPFAPPLPLKLVCPLGFLAYLVLFSMIFSKSLSDN